MFFVGGTCKYANRFEKFLKTELVVVVNIHFFVNRLALFIVKFGLNFSQKFIELAIIKQS